MIRSRLMTVGACAGFLVGALAPAFGYWSGAVEVQGHVAVARLHPPVVTSTVVGSTVDLRIAAPTEGPAPAGYTVSRQLAGSDGTASVCASLHAPGVCRDHVGAFAATRTYLVTGTLGSKWATTASYEVYTAPPAPRLSVVEGPMADDELTLELSAPAGESAYTVGLIMDGLSVGAPVVVSTTGVDRHRVSLHGGLGVGRHVVGAITTFHGAQAMSAELAFSRASDGGVTWGPADGSVGSGAGQDGAASGSGGSTGQPDDGQSRGAAAGDGPAAEGARGDGQAGDPHVSDGPSAPEGGTVTPDAGARDPLAGVDTGVRFTLSEPLAAELLCPNWTEPSTTALTLNGRVTIRVEPATAEAGEARLTRLTLPTDGSCPRVSAADVLVPVRSVDGATVEAGTTLTGGWLRLDADRRGLVLGQRG